MMMFPPFFGFNPYYTRGYGNPRNPYAPKELHKFSNYTRKPISNGPINNTSIFNNKNDNIQTCSSINNNVEKKNGISNNFNGSNNNNEYSKNCSSACSDKAENSQNEYSPFFSIFGIDLYFDDILILALLLFLNTEDVKDSYLYIVLIMLLFN